MRRSSIDKDTAERTRCARGFSSFKEWARQNKEGQNVNRQRGRHQMVKCLEEEYHELIKPNL